MSTPSKNKPVPKKPTAKGTGGSTPHKKTGPWSNQYGSHDGTRRIKKIRLVPEKGA